MKSYNITNSNVDYSPEDYRVNFILVNGSDMRNLVKSIVTEEDIHSSAIVVKLGVLDSINFLQKNKLSSGEEIEISISKHTHEGEVNIKKKMLISEISDLAKDGVSRQAFNITCVSPFVYNNYNKTLRRTFKGTIGDVISKIFSNDLLVKDADIQTSTTTVIKGIFPNMRPLAACGWLLKKANANGTPVYMYETFAEGVKVKSYFELISQGTKAEYDDTRTNNTEPGTKEDYLIKSKEILNISSPLNISHLFHHSSGTYSSTLYSLDTSTKIYKKSLYSYESKNKIEDSTLIPSEKTVGGKPYDSVYTNKQYNLTLNSNAFDALENIHGANKDNMHIVESSRNALAFITQEIAVNGNISLKAGDIVDLSIADMSLINSTSSGDTQDPMLSGKYMVVRLVNKFEGIHTQVLTLQRDYSGVES